MHAATAPGFGLGGISENDAHGLAIAGCAVVTVVVCAWRAWSRSAATGRRNTQAPCERTESTVARMQRAPEHARLEARTDVVDGKDTNVSTAQHAFDQIRSYLDADRLRYSTLDEQLAIRTGYALDSGDFEVWITIQEQPLMLGVHVRIPLVVPEPLRPQAAEAVVRANNRLMLGRFELDMSDGRTAFRSGMPLAETGVTRSQFDDLAAAALWSVDRYYRAFGRLVFGDDLSPAEVIAEVEMAET